MTERIFSRLYYRSTDEKERFARHWRTYEQMGSNRKVNRIELDQLKSEIVALEHYLTTNKYNAGLSNMKKRLIQKKRDRLSESKMRLIDATRELNALQETVDQSRIHLVQDILDTRTEHTQTILDIYATKIDMDVEKTSSEQHDALWDSLQAYVRGRTYQDLLIRTRQLEETIPQNFEQQRANADTVERELLIQNAQETL